LVNSTKIELTPSLVGTWVSYPSPGHFDKEHDEH